MGLDKEYWSIVSGQFISKMMGNRFYKGFFGSVGPEHFFVIQQTQLTIRWGIQESGAGSWVIFLWTKSASIWTNKIVICWKIKAKNRIGKYQMKSPLANLHAPRLDLFPPQFKGPWGFPLFFFFFLIFIYLW